MPEMLTMILGIGFCLVPFVAMMGIDMIGGKNISEAIDDNLPASNVITVRVVNTKDDEH